MANIVRKGFLQLNKASYWLIRPLIFAFPAQKTHDFFIQVLSRLDGSSTIRLMLRLWHRLAFSSQPVTIGRVTLPHPFILAAGVVKGTGYPNEQTALDAVRRRENIIPGWRTVPTLVGAVEFGSYTRWPRMGNQGTTVWRDAASRSLQNRVGLKNPGAEAAAEFLALHLPALPPVFGINLAATPDAADSEAECRDIVASVDAFLRRGVIPTWFTINLSCPNTEDDPGEHQTEEKARAICSSAVQYLLNRTNSRERDIPVWVKVSPNLADSQYAALLSVFHDIGIKAVIATNTLPQPAPGASNLVAGIGGGRLYEYALGAARYLIHEKKVHGFDVDIIGCGGILDSTTYRSYRRLEIRAVQYYSALIFRGPLAAAIIQNES